MTRYQFGQGPADWTFTVGSGDTAVLQGGVTITMWDLPASGTQYTDLLDSTGSPIVAVTSASGMDGLPTGTIPSIYGPDGVTDMWADAGGGYRARITAHNGYAPADDPRFGQIAGLGLTGSPAAGLYPRAVSGAGMAWTADGTTSWLNARSPAYSSGAKGDGTTDDTAAIQAALTAAGPGGTVYLPAGTYATSVPLTIPPQVRLLGSHGGHIDDVTGAVIKPLASFAGAAVILLVDQTTGGYAQVSAEQRIEQISIDGSALTGSTIDGIQAQGLVHGVYLTDVQVRHIPGHGINSTSNSSGTAYSWHAARVHVSASGGIGITASMTDASWIDCEVIGSASHGWFAGGAGNSVFIGCRAEWSSLDGFNLGSGTGTGSGSGGPTFVGCTTDRNGHNGFSIPSAANGNGPVTITGCSMRRDAASSTSSGFAGININASTQPVIITGCQTYPGTADDGTGLATPQYGLSVTGATSVSVAGGHFHAITEGVHDGGSNTRFARGLNITERTGGTGSPVTVTRGLQSYGTNGESLDVPQYLAGIPHPRAHGLAAWSFPPEQVASGKAGVAGTLYLAELFVPRPLAATKLAWGINTAGVSPVSGQSFVGLYDASGTRLASVGVDGRVTSTGAWLETISVALTPGSYWIAFLVNAATMPQIYRGGDLNAGLMNLNLGASMLRWATNGTGLTALPSSITPASNTAAQFSYWGGVG